MRVACIVAHGGIENLKLQDWPEPLAGPGQALIRVRACGLNYLDIFVRRGMPGLPVDLPRIPGGDIAGIVEAVGSGVDRSWIGKRVLIDPHLKTGGALGEHANGGLCEKIAVDGDSLIGLPDNVSFEQAASIPIAFGTARRMMMTRGQVQKGELVLVLGASGGVGVGCVQIARDIGATVIACASSPEKLERLRRLGAHHLIDYSKEDFSKAAWRISEKKGVDVCINFTGGDTWTPSIRTLRPQGRILTCGATAGYDPKEDLRYIWVREINILGSNGWRREDIEWLLKAVSEKRFDACVDRVFPLAQAAEAMRTLEDRQILGKVIVTP
jgi:alcohol dehydrogenase